MGQLTEQKTIDLFKDAPEGAEYSYNGNWYKVVNDVLFTYKVHGASGGGTVPFYWGESGYVRQLTERMIPRPVTSPTFTQAMYSHNIAPLVGMECVVNDTTFDDNDELATILYISKTICVYKVSEGMTQGEYSQNVTLLIFKPLTPPIQLVDGKAYQFDFGSNPELLTNLGLVGICHTSIKHGTKHVMFESPVNNSKWNTEYCTNIKPLTVESE